MIALICLFFPAVLGVWFFEHLQKTPLSRRQWVYRYCANVIFINCICFAAKRFLLDTAAAPFASLVTDVTPAAALNYLIMAVPATVIVAFLQVVFTKHATITAEEQKNV